MLEVSHTCCCFSICHWESLFGKLFLQIRCRQQSRYSLSLLCLPACTCWWWQGKRYIKMSASLFQFQSQAISKSWYLLYFGDKLVRLKDTKMVRVVAFFAISPNLPSYLCHCVISAWGKFRDKFENAKITTGENVQVYSILYNWAYVSSISVMSVNHNPSPQMTS